MGFRQQSITTAPIYCRPLKSWNRAMMRPALGGSSSTLIWATRPVWVYYCTRHVAALSIAMHPVQRGPIDLNKPKSTHTQGTLFLIPWSDEIITSSLSPPWYHPHLLRKEMMRISISSYVESFSGCQVTLPPLLHFFGTYRNPRHLIREGSSYGEGARTGRGPRTGEEARTGKGRLYGGGTSNGERSPYGWGTLDQI